MYIKTTVKKEADKHFIESIRIEITSNKNDVDLSFGDSQDGQELLVNVLSIKDALELAYDYSVHRRGWYTWREF